MLIVTLIAAEPLDDKQWNALGAKASDALTQSLSLNLLDPDYARDIHIDAPQSEQRRIRGALEAQLNGVDIIVQPANGRLKKLLISDMDSTMIAAECIDELADYAGIKAHIAEVTERAMRGELDFEAALRERVSLLKGLDVAAIATCLAERIRPMSGAATLVATAKSKGMRPVLVSGGFHHFADPVGEMLGFDEIRANVLEIEGSKLTGGLVGDIVDAAAKAALLRSQCAELGIETGAAIGLGDGANDIPMLEAAGLGLAYHAKPAAANAADAAIKQGDLTSALYAMGIPRSEWIVR